MARGLGFGGRGRWFGGVRCVAALSGSGRDFCGLASPRGCCGFAGRGKFGGRETVWRWRVGFGVSATAASPTAACPQLAVPPRRHFGLAGRDGRRFCRRGFAGRDARWEQQERDEAKAQRGTRLRLLAAAAGDSASPRGAAGVFGSVWGTRLRLVAAAATPGAAGDSAFPRGRGAAGAFGGLGFASSLMRLRRAQPGTRLRLVARQLAHLGDSATPCRRCSCAGRGQ